MLYHYIPFSNGPLTVRLMFRRIPIFALALVTGLPLLAGCGAIFGQRYDNFTAYYNTFYNAQREFDRTERQILRTDDPVDRSVFLALFSFGATTTPGRGQSGGFDSVIHRSADVLRDHPNSKWVDDALLLIGKSYFYQGNYDAAAQKFEEVLTLGESRLTDEAYFWLGRSRMEARDYGIAGGVLRDGLERENVRDTWRARMQLLLGENAVRQGDMEDAALLLSDGVTYLRDPELAARAYFLLGQVLDYLERYDEAAEAYGAALDQRPTHELEYAAELQRILALKRSEQYDQALVRAERLRRDDKFFQQRAEVEMIRARVLAESGRETEALVLYREILYDRDPAIRIDRIRGHLHYYLAELYRVHLDDYRRASAHFDTASTALQQSTLALRDVAITREAVTTADREAFAYGAYSRVENERLVLDSLLYLGSLSEEDFAIAIEEIAEQRRREALAAERERRRMEEQQGFGGGPVGTGIPGRGDEDAPGTGDFGFLGYQNPVRIQENLIAFQSRWGDRPLVPNWRRAAAIAASASLGEGENGELVIPDVDPARTGSMEPLVDISAIPRTFEARIDMQRDLAHTRYELANVLFLTLNQPERAIEWYQLVIEEAESDLPIVPRAYYALAEAYIALGDSTQADSLFQEINLQFDDSPLADAARERIGLEVRVQAPDSLQMANTAYEEAVHHWQEGHYRSAFQQAMELSEQFPGTESDARARLLAGMIYIEWAGADTLALLAGNYSALYPRMPSPEDVIGEFPSEEDVLWDDSFLDPPAMEWGDPVDVPEDAPEAELPDERSGTDMEWGNPVPVDVPEQEIPQEEPDDDREWGDPVLPLPDTTSVEIPEDELLEDRDADREPPRAEPDTPESPPIPLPDRMLPGAGPLPGMGETPQLEDDEPQPEPTVERVTPWLVEHLETIETGFPGTPFATRATSLKNVIQELYDAWIEAQAPSIPDEEESEEDDRMDPVEDEPDFPYEESWMRGEEPLVNDEGGYTWVVLSTSRQLEAQNRMIAFFNRGYRTAMQEVEADQGIVFQVLLGHFPTEEEAAVAEDYLPLGTDRAATIIIPFDPEIHLVHPGDLLGPAQPTED